VAWGTYARACSPDVTGLVEACIGCEQRCSVMMVDRLPVAGELCATTADVVLSASALHPGLARLHEKFVQFQKTKVLFGLLASSCSRASFYLKADTDAYVDLPLLSASLLVAPAASADYIGKLMQQFSFKGARLTYMQGGAYVLSRRAATAVGSCALGEWFRCPNSVLNDTLCQGPKPAAACVHRGVTHRCFTWHQTFTEDLFTGICLREAALAGGVAHYHHPCMIAKNNRHATSHNARWACLRTGAKCFVSEHPFKTRAALHIVKKRNAKACAKNDSSTRVMVQTQKTVERGINRSRALDTHHPFVHLKAGAADSAVVAHQLGKISKRAHKVEAQLRGAAKAICANRADC
jgi:hypothetical protein